MFEGDNPEKDIAEELMTQSNSPLQQSANITAA